MIIHDPFETGPTPWAERIGPLARWKNQALRPLAMHHCNHLRILPKYAAWISMLLVALPALQAAETDTNATSRLDFSAYRIIAERNIFNTNRSARVSRNNRPVERPKTVQSFSLVGTMSYEKGSFAFFDGTSADYRKVGSIQDRLAGFTIEEIRPKGVKLSDGTNQFDMLIGMQMRREDEAPWKLIATSETPPPARAEEASTSSASSSDSSISEILRRLKEKREKEMK